MECLNNIYNIFYYENFANNLKKRKQFMFNFGNETNYNYTILIIVLIKAQL